MYDITLQQIEAFLTVVRYLNVSRAAEALFVSQPTLSKMLRRFETGVGFPVFSRGSHGVALTPQGEYLKNALEPLYSDLERAVTSARRLVASTEQMLHVVVPTTFNMITDFLPLRESFDAFGQARPDICIRKHLYDLAELQWQFSFGSADLIIAPDFALNRSDLESEYVGFKRISPYVACMALDRRLLPEPYEPGENALRAIPEGVELFAVTRGDDIVQRERIRLLCKRNGLPPVRLVMVDNMLTLVERLSEGRGLILCARLTEPYAPENATYFPLKPSGEPLTVVAAWRKDRLTPQLTTLLNALPAYEAETPRSAPTE